MSSNIERLFRMKLNKKFNKELREVAKKCKFTETTKDNYIIVDYKDLPNSADSHDKGEHYQEMSAIAKSSTNLNGIMISDSPNPHDYYTVSYEASKYKHSAYYQDDEYDFRPIDPITKKILTDGEKVYFNEKYFVGVRMAEYTDKKPPKLFLAVCRNSRYIKE